MREIRSLKQPAQRWDSKVPQHLARAMWRGDVQTLFKIAPCACCCDEHTYMNCPARVWNGCHGQGAFDADPYGWARYYERTRGMSLLDFFLGVLDTAEPCESEGAARSAAQDEENAC